MPVRKFKAPPEHDDSLWLASDDPMLVPTIIAVWERADRLCPPSYPPGVYKRTSIESANRLTERWEHEALERARVRATRLVPESC